MEYPLKRETTCLVFIQNCRTFVFFSTTTQRVALSENSFASTYQPLQFWMAADSQHLRLLFRASHGCKSASCNPRITPGDRLASGSKFWEMHLLTSASRTQDGKGDLPLYCPQASPSSAPRQWVWVL